MSFRLIFFILLDVYFNNANIINDCGTAGLLPNLLLYVQMSLLSMSDLPSLTDTIKDLRNYCLKNIILEKVSPANEGFLLVNRSFSKVKIIQTYNLS